MPEKHATTFKRPRAPKASTPKAPPRTRSTLVDALTAAAGDVEQTARDLGMTRTAVEQWIADEGIEAMPVALRNAVGYQRILKEQQANKAKVAREAEEARVKRAADTAQALAKAVAEAQAKAAQAQVEREAIAVAVTAAVQPILDAHAQAKADAEAAQAKAEESEQREAAEREQRAAAEREQRAAAEREQRAAAEREQCESVLARVMAVVQPRLDEAARVQEAADEAARVQEAADEAARVQRAADEAARAQEAADEAARAQEAADDAARVQRAKNARNAHCITTLAERAEQQRILRDMARYGVSDEGPFYEEKGVDWCGRRHRTRSLAAACRIVRKRARERAEAAVQVSAMPGPGPASPLRAHDAALQAALQERDELDGVLGAAQAAHDALQREHANLQAKHAAALHVAADMQRDRDELARKVQSLKQAPERSPAAPEPRQRPNGATAEDKDIPSASRTTTTHLELEPRPAAALACIEGENRKGHGFSLRGLAAAMGRDPREVSPWLYKLRDRGLIVDRPIMDRGPKPRWWSVRVAHASLRVDEEGGASRVDEGALSTRGNA
jgi:hypothetical protein